MRSTVFLVAFVVLAGCSDGGSEGDPTSDPTDDPGGTPQSPGSAAPTGNDSAQAPRWQVGQSWTWRIESTRLPEALETKLVVLAADGATYDVGTTDAFDASQAYPFHLLGLGTVDAATLAWQAHGTPVQFLRFPLTDGDTFTADFWNAPGAEVEVVATNVTGPRGLEPGFRSTARYAGGAGVFIEADYAPARGQFVRVATYFGGETAFAEATLIGEGSGASGGPFRVTDLARWSANAGDPSTLTPRQGTVGDAQDRVLLACFLPAEPGNYQAHLSFPGGTTSCNSQDGLQPSTYQAISRATTPGPVAVTATVVGQGSITVEAFAIDSVA